MKKFIIFPVLLYAEKFCDNLRFSAKSFSSSLPALAEQRVEHFLFIYLTKKNSSLQ